MKQEKNFCKYYSIKLFGAWVLKADYIYICRSYYLLMLSTNISTCIYKAIMSDAINPYDYTKTAASVGV
jgi:hypothetical protein